jgi:hypothetical protein
VHNPAPMSVRKSSNRLIFVFALSLLSTALGCGGTDDNRPATWSFIAPAIIEPNCATASCHSAVGQRAGVVLTPQQTAYDLLTMRQFVQPNNSAESEIIALMRAEGSRRMPPDFALPEADIDLIARWIDAGASSK